MKRVWFNAKIILTSLFVVLAVNTFAQKNNDDFDPYKADIEENIKWPTVSAKQREGVVEEMAKLEKKLSDKGYSCTRVRSGEVVLLTIPCSELFASCDVNLKVKADDILDPLYKYIRRTADYKVIVAVHSDDTGDAEYSDDLTAKRATAIDDYYYAKNDNEDTGIIPYGLGYDEPLKPNNSFVNRELNRRVEIYFVPTKTLIENTKRK
ncbi:MAG: OmpA family protein [Muribaculaceae bacterium]|nr:OmpA family protein [Muribaculaceae bacterium]